MRITHLGHACVLVETSGARLLFDPGTLSQGFESLDALDAVLITHQHADHLDETRLPTLLAANPDTLLFVDEGSAPMVRDLGLHARTVFPGDRITLPGIVIDVVGGVHAVVHQDIPVVPNAAYVVDDGAFFHPGDSYFVPEQDVDILGLPTSGPWLKVGEAIDYLRAVAPRVAVPIHEAALANPASAFGMLTKLAPGRTAFTPLTRGDATEL
jgi:L-ascorbate metabolism protein UlaG (beta-lactamase superfamily)